MAKFKRHDSVGTKLESPHEEINYDKENPAFSLSFLQKGFSVKDCEQVDKVRLVDSLADMSQRSWAELKKLHKHKGGFERIPELQGKLPTKFEGMMPIAFRFSGMAPIIGVRVRQIYYLLWIDPKMELYRH